MMTFKECHEEIGQLVASAGLAGGWRVGVDAWDGGKVSWTAFLRAREKMFDAPTPDRLVELVLDYLASDHTAPMTAAEVQA